MPVKVRAAQTDDKTSGNFLRIMTVGLLLRFALDLAADIILLKAKKGGGKNVSKGLHTHKYADRKDS